MQVPFRERFVIEITSADTVGLVNRLSLQNIRVRNVKYKNDLTVKLTIPSSQLYSLQAIAEKQGATVKICKEFGIYKDFRILLNRPVLLVSLLFILLSALYLPSRVLFVTVEGNETIPTNAIIEAAEKCGIQFGANRRKIRSEKMKNALLEQMPQLQWAGVNTKGCVAIITVREKTQTQTPQENSVRISSIVAVRDGVIQDCTVLQGSGLCTVGQAVKAGQTLVSGYIDSGLFIRGTEAKAEITALTNRDVEMLAPNANLLRCEILKETRRFGIKIGKNLINFYKDSGNPSTGCAKIYSEKYLTLPGGFQLPIGIVEQRIIYYRYSDAVADAPDEDWLAQYAEDYLQRVMVAGQILSKMTYTESIDGAWFLYGNYHCLEMIGVSKLEVIQPKDD